MNLSLRLLAGGLFGILYAVIIALGYLSSNANPFAIGISAVMGLILLYLFWKYLTEPKEDDEGDDTDDE